MVANGSEILDMSFDRSFGREKFPQRQRAQSRLLFRPGRRSTFGVNLVADGSGGFGFDFAVGDPPGVSAVPEPSTWAMMLLGFRGP